MSDSVFQEIVNYAPRLYTSNKDHNEMFSKVVNILDTVTVAAVRLEESLANMPPVPFAVIKVFANPHVQISILVLQSGAKIPLHGYSEVFGLMKMLTGRVKVKTFDFRSPSLQMKILAEMCFNKKSLLAEELQENDHDENSSVRFIHAAERKCYEFHNDAGRAAMIQVLFPQSESWGGESGVPAPKLKCYCHVPIKVQSLEEPDKCITILQHIEKPPDFNMAKLEYYGPRPREEESRTEP